MPLKAFLKSLAQCILRSELHDLVNISNDCNSRWDESSDKSGYGFKEGCLGVVTEDWTGKRLCGLQ